MIDTREARRLGAAGLAELFDGAYVVDPGQTVVLHVDERADVDMETLALQMKDCSAITGVKFVLTTGGVKFDHVEAAGQ